MNYQEALVYLDGVIRTGIKYDLNNIRRLLDILDHPERSYPIVSIAGTNGKGSVCAFLESILTEAGYTVGLNTSPHLATPRERLRINRQLATKEEFARAITTVREASLQGWREDDPYRPTYFETMTTAALVYFRERKVDLALMEAGLGGRLDGTNSTQPILTIITRISRDHPKTLGNTLGKIAFEKFGLARNNRPLLLAHQRPGVEKRFIELARFRGSRLVRTGAIWSKKDGKTNLQTPGGIYRDLTLALPGEFQKENAGCAVRASEILAKQGFTVSTEVVRQGLARAWWPGRLEFNDAEPRLLIDGSHNPDGLRHLISELRRIPAQRRILIYATMGDKKVSSFIKRLFPMMETVLLPPVPVTRAMDTGELAKAARKFHPDVRVEKSIADAWNTARALYRPGDLIIVAGSLYLVGHFKDAIGDNPDNQ